MCPEYCNVGAAGAVVIRDKEPSDSFGSGSWSGNYRSATGTAPMMARDAIRAELQRPDAGAVALPSQHNMTAAWGKAWTYAFPFCNTGW
jgi:hypothetical protein